jgi:environmental stress-induced protein Ves
MTIKVRQAKDFITTNWSGGTTTELFIHPKESTFALRNFDFRLSTATVETETSTFTPLQGVSRKLLLLDGAMTLHHEGQSTQALKKFKIAEFNGDWKTTSIGKCIDLNLMLRGTSEGDLGGRWLEPEEIIHYVIPSDASFLFVYLYQGKMDVRLQNETYQLLKGDLLIIQSPSVNSLQFKAIMKSEMVLISVKS